MALQNIRRNGAAGAAILGLGALLVGCSRDVAGTTLAAAAAAAPVSVSCEPNQRAVVRQVPVNGALQAQVQCETIGVAGSLGAAAPVAYQPGFQPVGYNAGFVPIAPQDNTRIVGAAYPQPVVTRSAAPRRVTNYQRVPERISQPKRSVTKSAVIIGSSAGVGAGIGAAVGGKKGAGIGALLGGGGAAVWDQITRRR